MQMDIMQVGFIYNVWADFRQMCVVASLCSILMYTNVIQLAKTNVLSLAKTNVIRLDKTNVYLCILMFTNVISLAKRLGLSGCNLYSRPLWLGL